MSERERSAGRVTATAPSASSSSRLPGTPSDEDLPGVLALVGRLLEAHSPDEIAVLLREELDRREVEAYASGWQDAVAEYAPALEEALAAAAARPLRLVDRTPGQAAVIPFPQDFQSPRGQTGEGVAADRENPRGRSSRRHRSRAGLPDGDGEEAGEAGKAGETEASSAERTSGVAYEEEPATSRSRPAFAVKSRKSKVPTIPQITAGRRPPREPDPPAGTSPGETPEDTPGDDPVRPRP
ncbi:hypothetical protein [Streptomyces qinzhouensis]|uniref:Uncharacterized protein n=1 Tax=Streptomyces qinzhouensis TaxID=2599401 RepID=A0A5B8JLT2_9ACTN|nr:hypothetical protein [Streptomyces qinzhouensis]QDY78513.1 hypothetical protein FQU76_20655 [Streptomyces qinzhouensis]